MKPSHQPEGSPPPARPTLAGGELARLAAVLQRSVAATEACFEDILRHGRISPANARGYRLARAEAKIVLSDFQSRENQKPIPPHPGLKP